MEVLEGQVDAGGIPVHYYQAGNEGGPIVLLHGGGTDAGLMSWKTVYPALASKARVFIPDWPGYGNSPAHVKARTLPELVALLAGLLDAWGLPASSLIGVSLGGGVALKFTLDHPERVDKLVLVDSYGLQRRAPYHWLSYWLVRLPGLIPWCWEILRRSRRLTGWAVQAIFSDRRNVTEELVDEVFAAVNTPGAGEAFYAFQQDELGPHKLNSCFIDQMGHIQVDTMMVQGKQDSLVPLRAATEAARKLPHGRLEVISQAGHWPQREQPEEFIRVVTDFIFGSVDETHE